MVLEKRGDEMRPIEEIIKDVEDAGDKKPLSSDVGYEVVMYLEMLHDLMADTSYYFFRYAGDNLKPRSMGEYHDR